MSLAIVQVCVVKVNNFILLNGRQLLYKNTLASYTAALFDRFFCYLERSYCRLSEFCIHHRDSVEQVSINPCLKIVHISPV